MEGIIYRRSSTIVRGCTGAQGEGWYQVTYRTYLASRPRGDCHMHMHTQSVEHVAG